MKQVKINVIRAELMNFYNKESNSSKEMTKITYCVELSTTDRVVGFSILDCYKQGNILEKIKPFIMRPSISEIRETGTSNGTKWSISKIGDTEL